jgi:hypothetical protein
VKLTRYLKFLPLLAVFAFGVVLISMPKDTEATPIGAPSLSLTLVPINGTTMVTASYTDDTPPGSGSAILTASPAIGTFLGGAVVTPNNGESVTASGATVTVTEDADTLATLKTVTATFQCTTFGLTTFTISHGGTTSPQSVTLVCGDHGGQFPGYPIYPGFPQYPTYPTYPTFPTYPVNPGVVSSVTVSAAPASVTCANPSTITVTVKDQAGNLVATGTSVTVSASTGTVSPNVVSTSGGYATTTYMAPNNSNGTATVTATSGTGTGYATVSFTCTGTSAPSAPAPVYPPAYPDYTSGPITILPPNTGDAGLAAQAGTTTGAGAALVALSVIGLAAGVWTTRRQRSER